MLKIMYTIKNGMRYVKQQDEMLRDGDVTQAEVDRHNAEFEVERIAAIRRQGGDPDQINWDDKY